MDVVELLGRLLFASAFLISPSGVLQAAPRLAGSPALKAYPRAFAIAWTAAAAPEIVVMHGTRATSAASRIRYPSVRAPDPCGVLTTSRQRVAARSG